MAAANPLPGFALDDCEPIRANEIEHTVSWSGGASLKALSGKPVFLVFEVYDADLFGFRVAP